jgi:hypothetical protein
MSGRRNGGREAPAVRRERHCARFAPPGWTTATVPIGLAGQVQGGLGHGRLYPRLYRLKGPYRQHPTLPFHGCFPRRWRGWTRGPPRGPPGAALQTQTTVGTITYA